jgi:FMN phosphatase YigB (HAD superfamily)
MSRPLLISDCDDVLLHFAPHFADYVADAHGYTFRLGRPGFVGALTDETGADVEPARAWELLNLFFDAEMHRQHLVDGALEALRTIGREADIVILTNIGDQHSANRIVQLERLDIRHRVICNQGGKGRPVAELVAEMKPAATVFVDDLPVHHESVTKHAPEVWRLHMIAEPLMAAASPPSPFAHARIDHWDEALPWVLAKLRAGTGAS